MSKEILLRLESCEASPLQQNILRCRGTVPEECHQGTGCISKYRLNKWITIPPSLIPERLLATSAALSKSLPKFDNLEASARCIFIRQWRKTISWL